MRPGIFPSSVCSIRREASFGTMGIIGLHTPVCCFLDQIHSAYSPAPIFDSSVLAFLPISSRHVGYRLSSNSSQAHLRNRFGRLALSFENRPSSKDTKS